MDRFDLERAMLASPMPTLSKTLFLVLCTHLDARTGTILPQHQPSLSRIGRLASVCRSSVRNHLFRLEVEGWITTTPPDLEAQRRGARTCYALHVPGSPEHREAREGRPPAMKREARRARAAMALSKARARKTPGRGAVLDVTQPRRGSEPAASRPGSSHGDMFDAAMERAKARDAARGVGS